MKQIKTIHHRIDESIKFDEEINAAIAEGWQLTKREFVPSYCMIYAELEKEEIPESERSCENCAHYGKELTEKPCCQCSEGADKWEPYR